MPLLVWCISGSRAFLAFLIDDGALTIVESTIVPVVTCNPLATRCRCNLVKQAAAEIVLLQQMAEAAHRGRVRHRLAPAFDTDKTPHR